jgi:hypothetical protein
VVVSKELLKCYRTEARRIALLAVAGLSLYCEDFEGRIERGDVQHAERGGSLRFERYVTLVAVVLGGCSQTPMKPSPEIVISNLQSNVLGSYPDVCGGRGPGLTLTEFTFDFAVRGIDISADTWVNRLPSSPTSSDGNVLGQVAVCSSGPCSTTRRACITGGRSNTSGTIELFATEEYRSESSWTIEIRQNGQLGVRSNSLTTIVSYPRE